MITRGKKVEEIIRKFLPELTFSSKNPSKCSPYSVVITTTDRCPWAPGSSKEILNPMVACLQSVLNQDYLPVDIVIIDDSRLSPPDDFTSEFIGKFSKSAREQGVEIVHLKRGEEVVRNVPTARNKGLEICRERVVYMLDDDVVIPSHSARAAVELWDLAQGQKGDISVLNLPQSHRSTLPYKIINQKDLEKIDFESMNLNINASSCAVEEYLVSNPPVENGYLKPIAIVNFQGGNTLVDKSKVISVGGYTDFHTDVSYGEETALSVKLTKRNLAILYYPYLDLNACHLQFGNHSNKTKLVLDEMKQNFDKLPLEKLVEESDKKPKFLTGCRINSSYYFYMKLRNNYLIFAEIDSRYAQRWEQASYKKFVQQDSEEFVDKKEHDLSESQRRLIWQTAIEDARHNRVNQVAELNRLMDGQ